MIASVRGEIIDIALDHAIVEAAGVGYKVMATPSTLATLRRGEQARMVTAMIVREDSQTLYGFADAEARDLFSTLLSVSGVGPKIALATLAVYDVPTLRRALADGDVTALTFDQHGSGEGAAAATFARRFGLRHVTVGFPDDRREVAELVATFFASADQPCCDPVMLAYVAALRQGGEGASVVIDGGGSDTACCACAGDRPGHVPSHRGGHQGGRTPQAARTRNGHGAGQGHEGLLCRDPARPSGAGCEVGWHEPALRRRAGLPPSGRQLRVCDVAAFGIPLHGRLRRRLRRQ